MTIKERIEIMKSARIKADEFDKKVTEVANTLKAKGLEYKNSDHDKGIQLMDMSIKAITDGFEIVSAYNLIGCDKDMSFEKVDKMAEEFLAKYAC